MKSQEIIIDDRLFAVKIMIRNNAQQQEGTTMTNVLRVSKILPLHMLLLQSIMAANSGCLFRLLIQAANSGC